MSLSEHALRKDVIRVGVRQSLNFFSTKLSSLIVALRYRTKTIRFYKVSSPSQVAKVEQLTSHIAKLTASICKQLPIFVY